MRSSEHVCSELWHKHRRLLLPLLIVLPVPVPLVILVLAQRHATDLQQQEGHKRRTRGAQPRHQHLACSPQPAQPQRRLRRLPHQQPRRRNRNPRPQRRLAEVVGMARLGPQPVREELLTVLLGLLVRDPLALLPIGDDLEREAEDENGEAKDVSQVGFCG